MNKKLLSIILFLISFNLALGNDLPCQYTEIENYTEIETKLFYNKTGQYFGEPLNFTNFVDGKSYSSGGFRVNNPYLFDINVTLNYEVWGCLGGLYSKNIKIFAKSYVDIALRAGVCGTTGSYRGVIPEHIQYYLILESDNASPKKIEVTKFREVCKKCLGVNCTNDGDSCTNNNQQCGGGYCIRNICNNQPTCYNNDCKCKINEFQFNNSKCILKGSVELGGKPTTDNPLECTTNYINNSLCSKSPDVLAQEEAERQLEILNEQARIANEQAILNSTLINQTINAEKERLQLEYEQVQKQLFNITLVIIIISLTTILTFYFINKKNTRIKEENHKREMERINSEHVVKQKRHEQELEKIKIKIQAKNQEEQEKRKTEEAKQKTLDKEIERIKELKDLVNNQIIQIEKDEEELKRLRQIKNKTDEEINQINKLNKKLEQDKIEQEKLTKEYEKSVNDKKEAYNKFIEPHKSSILGRVTEWRNPDKDFYPCYVNSGKKTDTLIHVDQAKKGIFNKYVDFFNKHYPGMKISKNELNVHHIDKDKDNYKYSNLVIISKEEHDKINHNLIKDRASGINQLKKLGIKTPHITELN